MVGTNIVSLQFSPIFRPKFGEDQKKKRSSLKFSLIFRPKLGEDQTKTKKIMAMAKCPPP